MSVVKQSDLLIDLRHSNRNVYVLYAIFSTTSLIFQFYLSLRKLINVKTFTLNNVNALQSQQHKIKLNTQISKIKTLLCTKKSTTKNAQFYFYTLKKLMNKNVIYSIKLYIYIK